MKHNLITLTLTLFTAIGFSLLVNIIIFGCGPKENAQVEAQIVVLRCFVSTNQIPGYMGSPKIEQKVDSNGYLKMQEVPAVAVNYPPRTEVVTNYVLGYRIGTSQVELLTAEKR